MIGRLRGQIAHKHPPHLLLDVGGVGYELEASLTTFAELPEVGGEVSLHTHLLIRDDGHFLYGFGSEAERATFRHLIRVTGIGAKLALLILSGMNVAEFHHCVHSGDVRALTRLPGIGKKTAERLVLELRDRVLELPHSTGAGLQPAALPGATASPGDDAISALVALGYKLAEATRMVDRLDTEGLGSEEIIRRALQAAVR